MLKLNRKEKIFETLLLESQEIDFFTASNDYIFGFDAGYLAKKLLLSRDNVSRDLNLLYRENRVVKIHGKPVHYLPIEVIEIETNTSLPENSFSDQGSFLAFIRSFQTFSAPAPFSLSTSEAKFTKVDHKKTTDSANTPSPFSTLIGHNRSLKVQIKQATASILYPPHGLHTLLLGPTGGGKTTFATVMYKYAVQANRLTEYAPYIIFNCADYAGNPQLLLSHLFGHTKGAFTGAVSDKTGIIDKADGGILFLDEIHRLPPEGQEMLFSLIDRGEFYRLGDSTTPYFAQVLIIAATTEKPGDAILQTFLRRIPNVIQLPSLEERSLEERFDLITLFFNKEAKNMKQTVIVSSEILKLFLIYECPGNIGQLENDIKLICANAFANFITENSDSIYIKLSQLPTKYLHFFDILNEKRDQLNLIFDWNSIKEITFSPSDEVSSPSEEPKQPDFYTLLLNTSKKYFAEGLSIDTIKNMVDNQIANYFGGSKEFINIQNTDEFAFLKIASQEMYYLVKKAIDLVNQQFNIQITQRVFHGLVLHIETLIERTKAGKTIVLPENKIAREDLNDYYNMATIIVKYLEENLNITIPEQEIFLIALCLQTLNVNANESKVGILVITHGYHAANDFADIANRLLQVNHAHSITMPLEEKVSNTLKLATEVVKEIDEGKGVLLLVDMGSLTTFGDIITESTGIKTRTIRMVSTPMVLEATRKALFPSMTLERLIKEVSNLSNYVAINVGYTEERELLSKKFNLSSDRIVRLIEGVLTFVDTRKAIPLLEKVFCNIIEHTNVEQDQSLYIKFMFHTACLLERAIRNEQLEYKNLRHLILEKQNTYTVIKHCFSIIEKTYGITIADSEIAYITEIFSLHNSDMFVPDKQVLL